MIQKQQNEGRSVRAVGDGINDRRARARRRRRGDGAPRRLSASEVARPSFSWGITRNTSVDSIELSKATFARRSAKTKTGVCVQPVHRLGRRRRALDPVARAHAVFLLFGGTHGILLVRHHGVAAGARDESRPGRGRLVSKYEKNAARRSRGETRAPRVPDSRAETSVERRAQTHDPSFSRDGDGAT